MFDELKDQILQREMLKILKSIQKQKEFSQQSSQPQNTIENVKEDFKNKQNIDFDHNLIDRKRNYIDIMQEYQLNFFEKYENEESDIQIDNIDKQCDQQINKLPFNKCDNIRNNDQEYIRNTQQTNLDFDKDEDYQKQKQMIDNLYDQEEDFYISQQQMKLSQQNNKQSKFLEVKENKSIDLTIYATNDSESSSVVAPLFKITINQSQKTDYTFQMKNLKETDDSINKPNSLLPENHVNLTREMHNEMIKKENEKIKQNTLLTSNDEQQIHQKQIDKDSLEYQNKGQDDEDDMDDDIIQQPNLQSNDLLFETKREYLKTNKWESKQYKITYSNNDVYEGEVDEQSSLKDGWGVYFYSNGEKYEGFFSDDIIHGYGRYWFLGGHKYEGDWEKGQKFGIGQLDFASGDKYIGFFKKDNFHGSGEYFYKNGDKFEGKFINGKKNGNGKFIASDGRKIIGEWKDDQFLHF